MWSESGKSHLKQTEAYMEQYHHYGLKTVDCCAMWWGIFKDIFTNKQL